MTFCHIVSAAVSHLTMCILGNPGFQQMNLAELQTTTALLFQLSLISPNHHVTALTNIVE